MFSHYDQYDYSNWSFYFTSDFPWLKWRKLPCKNAEGDWIEGSMNDLGLGNNGDMKNNSVCVKEMSKLAVT